MTTYTFNRGFSPQVISNFAAGDTLDFSSFNIAEFLQLTPFIQSVNGDSILTLKYNGVEEKLTVENYTLTAADFIFNTSTPPLSVIGTSNVDVLFGGLGNDTLSGNGGGKSSFQGADEWLVGGDGDDTYFVRRGPDMVFEADGQGFDTVAVATVGYALPYGQEIERLQTTNASETSPIRLFGNNYAQLIIGNAGNNEIWDTRFSSIIAAPPGEHDTLSGLGGNDEYHVKGPDTVIVEAVGEGTSDVLYLLYGPSSYALSPGVEIERLVADPSGNTTLTGNAFAQTLVTGYGNDILNGMGGVDKYDGGKGDDLYYVQTGETIVEDVGEGFDRAAASQSFVLSASFAPEVELITTTNSKGTSAINLTGNTFAQELIGNSGSNILDGMGGHDTLRGLGGKDFFVFSTLLATWNVDTVADFNATDDTIRLEDTIFTAVNDSGALLSGYFRANATGTAQDSNDHILYETDTGKLYYDADANGAGAAIQFATLTGAPTMSAADFEII